MWYTEAKKAFSLYLEVASSEEYHLEIDGLIPY
jgi:hypothetical protein